MNIYQIGVWQTTYVKYSVKADTEDEAKDLISTGDDAVSIVDSAILNNEDWEIIDVKEPNINQPVKENNIVFNKVDS